MLREQLVYPNVKTINFKSEPPVTHICRVRVLRLTDVSTKVCHAFGWRAYVHRCVPMCAWVNCGCVSCAGEEGQGLGVFLHYSGFAEVQIFSAKGIQQSPAPILPGASTLCRTINFFPLVLTIGVLTIVMFDLAGHAPADMARHI